ncbi:NUDIX domain-containing protein [Nonomuraea sp. NPDC004580]|uniref:NUDIX hydrolase n=1 Tax=Nonomuraea sp. NPDC004580 TaxID=3154552 RepID=UPI0033A96103
MPQRQQVTVDVHVILERGKDILLCLRQGTGYRDGWFCLPSGHLDEGETVIECALRETREEVGVHLDLASLRPATVLHHLNPEGKPRIGFFFATSHWTGDIINAEPHKCAAVEWFPARRLPDNTVPYTIAGLDHYHRNQPIGMSGWPQHRNDPNPSRGSTGPPL